METEVKLWKVVTAETWWVMAPTKELALEAWYRAEADVYGADSVEAYQDDVGAEDPQVKRVQLQDAAQIRITDESLNEPCPQCGGVGFRPKRMALLALFREEIKKLSERKERRAKEWCQVLGSTCV